LSKIIRRLLLAPFLLGLIPSANAGIYYYPNYQKGAEKLAIGLNISALEAYQLLLEKIEFLK